MLQAHPSSFSPAVKKRVNTVHPSDTRTTNDQVETDEEPSTSGEALFQCPEEGCTKTFLRHSSMMRHLDCGKHQRALECETVFAKAALEYAEQLEGETTLEPVISTVCTRASHTYRQEMGWALSSSGSRRTRFTPTEKSSAYLTTKFRLGEQTGNKADPLAVGRSIMCAKDSNGSRLFTNDEFLTASQIAGFFSRLALRKTLVDDEQ